MDRQTDVIAIACTALAMQALRRIVKTAEICWDAANLPTDLSHQWAEVHHFVRTVLATAIPSVCHTPVLCQNDCT